MPSTMRISPRPARSLHRLTSTLRCAAACSVLLSPAACKRTSQEAETGPASSASVSSKAAGPSGPTGSAPPPGGASTSARNAASAADAAADAGSPPRGARVGPEAAPESYCAIFGSFPPNAKAGAERLKDKLASAGIPNIEVHDTSDYNELAWGQLAVLSVAERRADAEAHVTSGARVAKGFVKGCSPVIGDLTNPSPAGSAAKLATEDAAGCLGWNLDTQSAVCITGQSSIQGGTNETVSFLGTAGNFPWQTTPGLTFDAKVPAATVAKLRDALAKGNHLSLEGRRVRTLAPGAEAVWATPKLTVRYERVKRADVATSVGSWNDVSDRIELDCANKKTTLFSHDVQGAHDGIVRMYFAPEKALLLVEWSVRFALEGDSGGFHEATLLALDRACAPG